MRWDQTDWKKTLARFWFRWRSVFSGAEASQIVEFAVALPLLVVLVFGIFDFGTAFNLKHKVANTAREAARFASNQPTVDLSQGLSASSPVDIATLVGNYLISQKVNACGLAVNAANGTGIGHPSVLVWTFTASGNGCVGTLEVDIDRGATFTSGISSFYPNGVTVEVTKVTLSYPYRWEFNNVIHLLVPGADYSGTTQITATAIMQNLN